MPSLNEQTQMLNVYARQQQDGLTMFRAISPDIAPGYPDQVSFFESEASECLVRGGNRSSKTTCSAVKVAAICRDEPVRTVDGRKIDCRMPWQKDRPLTVWIIGLQLNHIGQTIHRVLFKAGLYKIIPDLVTGEWRAFRPWDPEDRARESACKPSWPLIPESHIADWAWDSSSQKVFERCVLKNGTEIYAFASTADVKTGDPVDLIWIDEAIANPEHYPEWQMRLPDRKGRIIWSSWPRKGNPALLRLTERAQEQAEELERGEREKINVQEFVFTFRGNPFIDDEEKQKVCEGLPEEELIARDFGEYALEASKIYPTFDRHLHAAVPDQPQQDDEIAKILRENGFVPPADWTHEVILDPGTAKPGVLFGAVPPPQLWGGPDPVLVVYKEIYRPRQTAHDTAKQILLNKPPGVVFHRFIIDGQAARQQQMGYAKTVGENYSDEFAALELQSVETGTGFAIGDPNFGACRMKVESLLALQDNGRVRLRIVTQACRQLVWQMENNQLDVKSGIVQDKEAMRQKNDLRKCLEYWVSRTPTWVQPVASAIGGKDLYREFLDWKHKMNAGAPREPQRVQIGPSSSLLRSSA